MRCGWWNRWLHRRKRTTDTAILRPVFMVMAMDKLAGMAWQSSDHHAEAISREVEALFVYHAMLDGNEHWRCQCFRDEIIPHD